MKTLALSLVLSFSIASFLYAQTEKKAIRQGNREFNKNDFTSSEISYRKALEKNPSSFKGNFNLADALYKQDKHDETIKLLDGISSSNVNDVQKSNVYYNMGNTYLKQQKLKESIESYKKSLRLNPNDQESKYNLAAAQRMLKQQQQQDQNDKNNKDNKDNKDKNKDKDKKDQENKDKNKQNQDQKDKNQQQPQQQKISQEDARRMLEALQNNEKDIQKKMREQKAKAARVRVEKNW